MKEQATGNRQQATESRDQGSGIRHQAGLEGLLRNAMPIVGGDAEPSRDLWPLALRRIENREAEVAMTGPVAVPWYDWALAAGVLTMVVVSPVSVPVLLYYL